MMVDFCGSLYRLLDDRLNVEFSYALSSQSFCDSRNDYLSVCLSIYLSVCLSVCPAIKAYISVTISRILMKLGENVGT